MGSKFSPLDKRIRAYPEVMKLAKAGVASPSMIMRTLDEMGINAPSRETVRRWVLGANSPFSNLNVFVPEPSETLSFFIGAWYGDGWGDENDGGGRLRLKVRSKSFAEEFADAASEILHKTIPYRVWVTRDDDGSLWYNVKVTSKMLYEFVTQDLAHLLPFISKFPKGFLRGFFTAEGNPAVSVIHSSRPWLSLAIEVSNSDFSLIDSVRKFLIDCGFVPGKIRLNMEKGKRTNIGFATSDGWTMTLSKFDDIKQFSAEVGFADFEKQEKLLEAITLLMSHGRYEAAKEWVGQYVKLGKKWTKIGSGASAS